MVLDALTRATGLVQQERKLDANMFIGRDLRGARQRGPTGSGTRDVHDAGIAQGGAWRVVRLVLEGAALATGKPLAKGQLRCEPFCRCPCTPASWSSSPRC